MEMHKHGEVCWSELATHQPEECKAFYTELFGWQYKESQAPGMVYTEISRDGEKQFGGLYKPTPEMGDVPSHWISYVAVDDIDASLQKASELGGTVLVPATDIPNTGRFGIISDPSGASIAMITLKFE